MAVDVNTMRAMQAAGCTVEQILAVAEAAEFNDREQRAAKREADRVRKRRQRDRERVANSTIASDDVRVTLRTPRDAADTPSPPPASSPDKEIPHTPLENNLFSEPPPQPRFPSAREFDAFWARYPNKVGKADAFKAFDRAVKRVDIETLMAGLDRYVAKTDDRPWCNPSTWLNQDRWADQPAQSPPRGGSPGRRMTMAEQTGQNLRQDLERKYGSGAGRQENQPLPAARRLLAIGGKTE